VLATETVRRFAQFGQTEEPLSLDYIIRLWTSLFLMMRSDPWDNEAYIAAFFQAKACAKQNLGVYLVT
jgi:hypothetical protein